MGRQRPEQWLGDPRAAENKRHVEPTKWHVLMFLQSGEKMHLNVYKSPHKHRSNITHEAAVRLRCKRRGERHMNLIDEKGKKVSKFCGLLVSRKKTFVFH